MRHVRAWDGLLDITFTVSLACSPLTALVLVVFLYLEDQRLPRPSDLAIVYLLASILCDAVALTAPFSVPIPTEARHPVLARLLGHTVLLLLEYLGPRAPPSSTYTKQSPEEQSDILSRAFFSWVNPILVQGYKNILIHQDLPHLSQGTTPNITRRAILEAWSERGQLPCAISVGCYLYGVQPNPKRR